MFILQKRDTLVDVFLYEKSAGVVLKHLPFNCLREADSSAVPQKDILTQFRIEQGNVA